MLLLKDGVKYLPYEYLSEEELTQMIIEHIKEIFGTNALYFDPQTMKTQIGIEARTDGIILTIDKNRWFILEVELAKHPLPEHIIPQITKFSIAYEETGTRRKIVNTLYNAIREDLFKTAIMKQQNIEDLHKTLTELIDIQPTIVIIIDQKTPELDYICKKLPFPTTIIEFKTYTRENISIEVHIHEFQPLFEERIEIRPKIQEIISSKEVPQKLLQVLEVADLVFKGEQLNKAFKDIAKQHSVHESTVRDKCTRQLHITTEQFRQLIQDKNRLKSFLKEKYPQHTTLINEKLT
ncbi:MAG: hypothetical protein QHH18_07745 [Candidatus Bathyarchaeota archaeon]|jgi:hypothetical protein|nr:hypothetical protein [Candidatus Bathyarchaeota archaeon A05DMB-5]MDH7558472.1 hypothetical protein [Candidatus Bathyarchaeota archaeon]